MTTCQKCDYQSDDQLLLVKHAVKFHKETELEAYISYMLEGKRPTCACGCLTETRFYGRHKGFSKYAHGHAARINNNWGHNQQAKDKSLKKRRDEGLWSKVPWNKGKTKQNDPEFAEIAEKAYGSESFRNARSKNMTKNRLNKIVPDLVGNKHPNWKGGKSSVPALSRSHLYSVWVYPKLKSSGFKCEKCGSTAALTVHHDKVKFAEILSLGNDVLGNPGDDFSKKTMFAEWVAEYHVRENVSGMVLCTPCHRNEHAKDQQTHSVIQQNHTIDTRETQIHL